MRANRRSSIDPVDVGPRPEDRHGLEPPTQTTSSVADGAVWSYNDRDAATVDADGAVTSHSPSTPMITATSVAEHDRYDAVTLAVVPVHGTVVWTRQVGTSARGLALGVAANADHVVAVDRTRVVLKGTHHDDAFARSYGVGGELHWSRQFGADSPTIAIGLAIDGAGNVYVGGSTDGDLESPNLGTSDAFVRAYERDGHHRWTRQIGTARRDLAFDVATDPGGHN